MVFSFFVFHKVFFIFRSSREYFEASDEEALKSSVPSIRLELFSAEKRTPISLKRLHRWRKSIFTIEESVLVMQNVLDTKCNLPSLDFGILGSANSVEKRPFLDGWTLNVLDIGRVRVVHCSKNIFHIQ